ncbi:UNVERIFIED_CONTAM: colanic acid/amylovoran biosynthesis glycosyltransferase [Brevibacillus sp. OAP136]
MDRVLVYRRKYLQRSETFIYEQLIGHKRVQPVVLTRSRPVNVRQFPYSPIHVKKRLGGMKHWLKKKHIKLIHARFGTAGVEMIGIARKSKVPLLTSFHGFDATKQVKASKAYRSKLGFLFKKGSAFTAVSDHMKRRLIKLGCPAKKITLVRSGIDLQKFPFAPPHLIYNDQIRILSVGRLTEKKGMDTLIRAFAYVRKKYPNARLLIVGEGEEKAKLKRIIRKEKLKGFVKLAGALPHAQVQQELRHCHLFVIGCKTAKNGDQEGIPNVLMEAMATGRPVISTRHAGIPELIKHERTGFLVPEKSPAKLGRMITRVLAERETWPAIVAQARLKVAEQHDITKQRRKLEDLYVSLIEKHRAGGGKR